jgi:PKD repeat protein
LYLRQSDAFLENDLVVDNRANVSGSGLYIWTSSPRLRHTTIARNSGGDGSGIYVTDNRITYSTVGFTNTIIVSHTLGITVAAGNTVALEATLWGTDTWANDTDWGGAGNISTGTINIRKAPAFEDPAGGDYHITVDSAALDEGVNAGVSTDVDDEPRPMRSGYDIGADELPLSPVAYFTHSAPDWEGQETVFNNTTVPSVTNTYLWTFGDGVTSTLEDPTHTYSTAGFYTVTLTATNQAGRDTVTDTLTIYSEPSAGFWGQPTQGIRPLTVAFTDATTTMPFGDPTLAYLWRFGDGSTSTQSDPTHEYTAAGVYTVTLVASNAAGSDALTRTNYVMVYEPVQADFAAVPTSGWTPLVVTFTNLSTGDYTSSTWNFGDGMTSTVESPIHTYAVAGTYSVTLAISGPGGDGLETKAECITVIQGYRVFLPLMCSFVWPYYYEGCLR